MSREKGSEDAPFKDPVVLPLEDSIDLHAFAPKDIASVVEEYLEQWRQAGFREVRLIHGRGKGVQRRIVQSLLERHPQVLSYEDAPAEAGGWGATIVRLNPEGK
jgi:dsDNA-specific endonuclease/ATPase MutS2